MSNSMRRCESGFDITVWAYSLADFKYGLQRMGQESNKAGAIGTLKNSLE